MLVYSWSATTVRTLCSARFGNWMRVPSATSLGSSCSPLSSTLCTVRVIASMNVLVPAVAVNVTVDVERNTSSPVVRSRATW